MVKHKEGDVAKLKPILLTFCILGGMFLALTADARQVRVRGYYRKDGTYVSPHVRNVGGHSKSSSSYRTWSRGSHASSYDTRSYNTSAPSWQPQETQDNGTFPIGVKEQEGSKQDEVFLSDEMAKNGNTIDEEEKREEVERKRQEAARQYREEAEMGNVKAQFKLAWCYEKGVGVKRTWKPLCAGIARRRSKGTLRRKQHWFDLVRGDFNGDATERQCN